MPAEASCKNVAMKGKVAEQKAVREAAKSAAGTETAGVVPGG